jgi:hypothetical protein
MRTVVVILLAECSSRLFGLAQQERKKRTSLFTDDLPHEVATKSLEPVLAPGNPTQPDDKKLVFIAQVISPIVLACQLFLSKMMYFAIL